MKRIHSTSPFWNMNHIWYYMYTCIYVTIAYMQLVGDISKYTSNIYLRLIFVEVWVN